MSKGYKAIPVKPDTDMKADYKRSGDKAAVQSMVRAYNKQVRNYFKKYVNSYKG